MTWQAKDPVTYVRVSVGYGNTKILQIHVVSRYIYNQRHDRAVPRPIWKETETELYMT